MLGRQDVQPWDLDCLLARFDQIIYAHILLCHFPLVINCLLHFPGQLIHIKFGEIISNSQTLENKSFVELIIDALLLGLSDLVQALVGAIGRYPWQA